MQKEKKTLAHFVPTHSPRTRLQLCTLSSTAVGGGHRSLSGETVLHENLWDRSPFVCSVRGRREHEEQIVENTRAVYPGSGRGGRVKPYSCLVCIELESSGA